METVAPAGIVVFFYGGDWQKGSKKDYRFVAQALARRPIPIEWEEPPETPVPAPAAQPAPASLPH